MGLSKYFNKKEINSLIVASIVLGFVFSFRQWGYEEFSLAIGITNWIRSFLLSFIVFSIYLVANKNIAKLYGASIKFKVWGMERFWFNKKAKVRNLNFFRYRFKTFKAGVFIPILLSLFSNGFFKWSAIGYTEITDITHKKVGKSFKNLTDFEIARIHLTGPIACLLIFILLSSLDSFNSLAEIAKWVAIFSFVPFSKLDGAKILFGSLPLYLLGLLFLIGSLVLINIIPPLATIFLALIIAVILVLIYLYRSN
jgi:hypothetical protein